MASRDPPDEGNSRLFTVRHLTRSSHPYPAGLDGSTYDPRSDSFYGDFREIPAHRRIADADFMHGPNRTLE
jgi:hypothetical protein